MGWGPSSEKNLSEEENETSMKLIGAGYPRTGTLSAKMALEQLGVGPCYHFHTLFERPQDIDAWQATADGTRPDWKALFADFHAAIDWPVSLFYRQLTQVFPEAKVVLTIRDGEAWYKSMRDTVYFASRRVMGAPEGSILHKIGRLNDTLGWQGHFHGGFEEKGQAISVFERHTEQVKETVPAERLLIWEVKDGWEPLCQFLGVPVPESPFPRVNDTKEFLERLHHMSNKL